MRNSMFGFVLFCKASGLFWRELWSSPSFIIGEQPQWRFWLLSAQSAGWSLLLTFPVCSCLKLYHVLIIKAHIWLICALIAATALFTFFFCWLVEGVGVGVLTGVVMVFTGFNEGGSGKSVVRL